MNSFIKWKILKRESAVLKVICRQKMRSSGRQTKRLVNLPMPNRQLKNIFVRSKAKTTRKRKEMTLNNTLLDEWKCPSELSEPAERKTNRLKKNRPEKCLCEQISGLCLLFSSKRVCCHCGARHNQNINLCGTESECASRLWLFSHYIRPNSNGSMTSLHQLDSFASALGSIELKVSFNILKIRYSVSSSTTSLSKNRLLYK